MSGIHKEVGGDAPVAPRVMSRKDKRPLAVSIDTLHSRLVALEARVKELEHVETDS